MGGNGVVAGKGADSGDLVRRQHHSQSCATDQNAAISLATRNLPGDFLGVVGIIHRIRGIRPQVPDGDALAPEILADLLF